VVIRNYNQTREIPNPFYSRPSTSSGAYAALSPQREYSATIEVNKPVSLIINSSQAVRPAYKMEETLNYGL
jgi:hypothetical protein